MENENCEVVRDLIPLCVDGVCSPKSEKIVKEHIEKCKECSRYYKSLLDDEIENKIGIETQSIIDYQKKKVKKSSMIAGSTVGGIFALPTLICLIVNLATGKGLDWFFIVLSSLSVAASLCLVPILVPSKKGLWTLASFIFSLTLLLGVCCIYTHGNWFFIAASSTWFGLSLIFVPILANSKKIKGYLGKNRAIFAFGIVTLLFVLMLFAIAINVKSIKYNLIAFAIAAPILAIIWIVLAVKRIFSNHKRIGNGISLIIIGTFLLFANNIHGLLLGINLPIPKLSFADWTYNSIDANCRYIVLAVFTLLGIISIIRGLIDKKRGKENEK